ncbi:hypothetical protein THAPSDRAFT_6174 [Thalassiosira pseudonana CCMP1335]|uniref:Uncharacterized protein n=1 Tax=Thalassiosira pseudonana TaxID=35128 RepID=B8C5S4_THAPS|nr:hypothetical protein THAPSDRAFT_6174 [Thalassiosira pseudonana CCMP1335]EED91553.1 hypothetical protein THAPSDRAFT_6174 [Thalassiosira pseudonana CCMP1335]
MFLLSQPLARTATLLFLPLVTSLIGNHGNHLSSHRSTVARSPSSSVAQIPPHGHRRRHPGVHPSSSTSLKNDLRDEIEQAAQRRAYENRAKGDGVGSTATGAVIGGILGGPFVDKARQEELKRKGLTPDMLDMASDVGVALKQAVEGLRATHDSMDTSQRLAKNLDRQSETIYERAKAAIASGDEETARTLLEKREAIKEKLLKVLRNLAEDKKRLATMESNVEALEARGLEIESLLRRSVGAAALKDTDMSEFSLEPEDPLLKKFRDLGM